MYRILLSFETRGHLGRLNRRRNLTTNTGNSLKNTRAIVSFFQTRYIDCTTASKILRQPMPFLINYYGHICVKYYLVHKQYYMVSENVRFICFLYFERFTATIQCIIYNIRNTQGIYKENH